MMTRSSIIALALVAVVNDRAAADTLAGASPTPTPAEPTTGDRWYGGPAVLSDLGAFGLIAASPLVNERTHAVFYAGVGAYLAGGPINHFDNANTRGAALSFGARALGMVATVAWVEFASKANGCGSDSLTASCDLLWLTPIPLLATTIVDDWILSRTASRSSPKRERGPASSLEMAPGVLVAPGIAGVSFRGCF